MGGMGEMSVHYVKRIDHLYYFSFNMGNFKVPVYMFYSPLCCPCGTVLPITFHKAYMQKLRL